MDKINSTDIALTDSTSYYSRTILTYHAILFSATTQAAVVRDSQLLSAPARLTAHNNYLQPITEFLGQAFGQSFLTAYSVHSQGANCST